MFAIDGIVSLVDTVVTRIWPDKTEQEKEVFTLALQQQLQNAATDHDQANVDAVEAASTSLFVAGWRPMVGWICAAAFAWQYVICPVANYCVALTGHPPLVLPVLDTADLDTLLFGLLGMGAMHSYEKVKGIK